MDGLHRDDIGGKQQKLAEERLTEHLPKKIIPTTDLGSKHNLVEK